MYKFCPNCGTKNNNYKFCPNCGMRLDDDEQKVDTDEKIEKIEKVVKTQAQIGSDEMSRSTPNALVIRGGILVTYIGDAPIVDIPDGVTVIGPRAFFG